MKLDPNTDFGADMHELRDHINEAGLTAEIVHTGGNCFAVEVAELPGWSFVTEYDQAENYHWIIASNHDAEEIVKEGTVADGVVYDLIYSINPIVARMMGA